MGLHVWVLVRPFVYFHTLCVRTAKALATPEPSLFAYAISTIISWTVSYVVLKHFIMSWHNFSLFLLYPYFEGRPKRNGSRADLAIQGSLVRSISVFIICPVLCTRLQSRNIWKKYMQTEDPLSLSGLRQANLVLIAYASSEGSGEPAHPRSLARTFAARSYKHWVKRNLQTESQIPGPSEWLGMRSYNLLWRNARRHKFARPGSSKSDHFHTNNMMSSWCT